VWHERRRLAQLEREVAEARAAQAALQQRVALFEKIAAAAGAEIEDHVSTRPNLRFQPLPPAEAAPTSQPALRSQPSSPSQPYSPAQPVPTSLLAAAADPRPDGSAVRLAVGGNDLIVVIGDEGGNPREWWVAIQRLAAGLRSAS
jgi:hypothetical protein